MWEVSREDSEEDNSSSSMGNFFDTFLTQTRKKSKINQFSAPALEQEINRTGVKEIRAKVEKQRGTNPSTFYAEHFR